MAAVRYHEILDALRLIFESDPRTADAPVFVEKDPWFDVLGAQRAILVTLMKRKPHDDQPIAAGKRTRYELHIGVWACGYAIEISEAARIRDELLGQVELVLMANRTIREKVETSWLMGGDFLAVQNDNAIFASAETEVIAQVTSSIG
jgi:hypothetical protein